MLKVTGIVKSYDWGSGHDSLVCQLANNGNHIVPTDTNTFAELWIGTHPSGRSNIPHDLPYLLKVLSIQKALSIQVHPNKEQAQRLHTDQPDVYKDPNPKPEVAVALSETFEALAGLLTPDIVSDNLEQFPELTGINTLAKYLQSHVNIVDIVDRIIQKSHHSELDCLILRLNKQFPGDVGVLCPIYIQYHKFKRGQAMYIPPGCPHAYISGEIVEAMICSDNVVCVGLTNKHKDIPTLIAILSDSQPDIFDSPLQAEATYIVDGEFTLSIMHTSMDESKQLEVKKYTTILVLEGKDKGHAFFVEKQGWIHLPSDNTMYAVIC